jgi:DNA-directed RNA polymerase specialized sigma24 family protein
MTIMQQNAVIRAFLHQSRPATTGQSQPRVVDSRVDSLPDSPHSPDSILALAGAELQRAVFRTANALLASSADAEEVTLDVLAALHAKLTELGEDGLRGWLDALPSWLDRAAVSKAKGRAKKRKHHSRNLSELTLLTEQLHATERRKMATALLVKEVLGYLPRRHRFVFVLRYGLGHAEADICGLTGLDVAGVNKTLATVEQKLAEYAAHHPLPKAMLEGMAAGVEDNPLRDYMEAFAKADEVTEARIQRRFETYLRDDPSGLELSGSFHDNQLSGFDYRVDEVLRAATEAGETDETETEPELDVDPDPMAEQFRDRRWGGWVVAGIAAAALIAVAYSQVQLVDRLETIEDSLRSLAEHPAGAAPEGNGGPVLLEPGAFVELAHDSRAEPAKDATVELLRNDAGGAEFRLSAGAIGLHVKEAKDAQWMVHDGRYDIVAEAARFRVRHTGSVPEVEVFEGEVRVTGGLLGAEEIAVPSSVYSLAAAMRARGGAGVAEVDPYAAVDPKDAGGMAIDEVYGRALALRATDEAKAEALLREIVDRGADDWISELAFEQLRTLVDPDERLALQQAYAERFPGGQYAEPFAAIACQALSEDEAGECWTEFDLTYPNSLYGP